MRSARTLTYALVILAAAHLLTLTVKVPAVVFLLTHAGFGGFIPLALATAAGITNDKAVLLGTVALALLVAIPGPTERLASALLPIGLGIVIGTLIGRGIREAKETGNGEPIPRHDQPRT
jgi:hypothetical protein